MNIVATVKHIKIYNANYAKAIDYLTLQHDEFTDKPILNDNGDMIQRDFYLLDGINCDPYSFQEECEAVNARFQKNSTYNEIKAHHYIISFDPRDKDDNHLTPERAHVLILSLAKRVFPGHQIIVCTHRDGHNQTGNIHTHIVLNSVRKDSVPLEEFMERNGDTKAGNKHHASDHFMNYLKQQIMDLCQHENLYQIDLLSPAKIRITDREYWADRRGQRKLNPDKAAHVETAFETKKSVLTKQITSTMNDAHSLDDFKNKLFERYGISLQEIRDVFTYYVPDREKPIRGRSLGTNFEKEYITNRIEENANNASKDTQSIQFIVNIKNCIKAQQNRYYAQKVKISNLKQASKTLAFLQENHIGSEEELQQLSSSTKKDQQEKLDALHQVESRLKHVNQLIHSTGQYYANKSIYTAFLKAKNKKEFRQHHNTEILLYEAARKQLNALLNNQQIPSIIALKHEKEQLIKIKNKQYEEYTFARAKVRELHVIVQNIHSLLNQKDIIEKSETQRL